MNKELYIDSPEAGYPSASELRKKGMLLEGERAIAKAQELKGEEPLTAVEREIALREGYSPVPYLDDRNVLTAGFGQTGKNMDKSFLDIVAAKQAQISKYFPSFNDIEDDELKAALMSLYYRGDVKKDYNWVKEFNKGNYDAAATNLLDNDEYKRRLKQGRDGVVVRLEDASNKIKSYGQPKTVTLQELLGLAGTGLENPLLARTDMFT